MSQVANLKSILKQASGLSTTPKSVVKPPISKQVKVLAGTSSQKALSIDSPKDSMQHPQAPYSEGKLRPSLAVQESPPPPHRLVGSASRKLEGILEASQVISQVSPYYQRMMSTLQTLPF
jgi:hypothetical protein